MADGEIIPQHLQGDIDAILSINQVPFSSTNFNGDLNAIEEALNSAETVTLDTNHPQFAAFAELIHNNLGVPVEFKERRSVKEFCPDDVQELTNYFEQKLAELEETFKGDPEANDLIGSFQAHAIIKLDEVAEQDKQCEGALIDGIIQKKYLNGEEREASLRPLDTPDHTTESPTRQV